MKKQNLLAAIAVLCGVTSSALAYPISLSLITSQGVFLDGGFTQPVGAGAFYQVYWSSDASYGGTDIDAADAVLTANGTTPASFGDYVLFTGFTDIDGGLSSPVATGVLNNGNVNGNLISSGYVYVYLYESAAPTVGDSYVRSPIYGPPSPTWGDASAALPPPPDTIDINNGSSPSVMGTYFVVPEPASMALFGLGALTMALRRRKK